MMRAWILIFALALRFSIGSSVSAAEFTVEYPDITFTPARANATMTTAGLTVINTGSEPLEFVEDGISISDSAGGVFSVFGTPDLSPLEAGARRTFVLAFAPVDLGFGHGEVLIETNALNPAEIYPLTGIGYQLELTNPTLFMDIDTFGAFHYQNWFFEIPGFSQYLTHPSAVIIDTQATNLVALWATMINRPDGENEMLARSGSPPAGIQQVPYDPQTGRIMFLGSAPISSYRDVLYAIRYQNLAVSPDAAERQILFYAIDDRFVLSVPVYSHMDVMLPPPDISLNLKLDEPFDGAALDTANNWTVVSGAAPTVGNSEVSITNSLIETKLSYRGIPMWFSIEDASYANLGSSGQVGMLIGTNIGNKYAFLSIYNNQFYGNGSSSYGTLNGNIATAYEPGPNFSTTPFFDVSFAVSGSKGFIFGKGIHLLTFEHLNGLGDAIKLRLQAANGATLNVDRVRIGEELTGNPAWRLIENGPKPLAAMGVTGVSAATNMTTFTPKYLKATRIDRIPTGDLPAIPLPYYWLIEGMLSATFTADLVFEYDPAEVAAAGIDPDTLDLYVSTNTGRSWIGAGATADPENSRFVLSGVNAVRPYAIMGQIELPDPALQVLLNSSPLSSGGDPIDFGAVTFGAESPGLTFEVRNNGAGPLSVSALTPPGGFIIAEGLGASIAAGASDTMTISMPSTAGGVHAGNLTIDSNDPAFAQFVIPLTGRVEMTEAWVDFNYSGVVAGTQTQPFKTLDDALAALLTGGTIKFKPGSKLETRRIDRAMRLEAVGGAVRIGDAP